MTKTFPYNCAFIHVIKHIHRRINSKSDPIKGKERKFEKKLLLFETSNKHSSVKYKVFQNRSMFQRTGKNNEIN